MVYTGDENWTLLLLRSYNECQGHGARGPVLGAELHTKEHLNTDHGKQNNSFYSCHSKLQINASISRTFW